MASLTIDSRKYFELNRPIIYLLIGVSILVTSVTLLIALTAPGPLIAIMPLGVIATFVTSMSLLIMIAFHKLRAAGWVGIKIEDNKLIIRYIPCIWIKEVVVETTRAQCKVELIDESSTAWPSFRICGVVFRVAYGLFKARGRGTVYLLADELCHGRGIYVEVDKLRLVICTAEAVLKRFYEAARKLCPA